MFCTQCGKENPPSARFCFECGNPVHDVQSAVGVSVRRSTTAARVDGHPKGARTNWIARHWRGDFTLARSYWVNFLLVTFGFTLIGAFIGLDDVQPGNELLVVQLSIGLLLISIVAYVWQLVGCWRSANRHIEGTGRSLWPRVVQVILVVGLVFNANSWFASAPALVELAAIATRTEPFTDYTITALHGGEEIEIDGHMAFGLGQEFATILDQAPGAWLLHLNSQGGRIAPARLVRDLIVQHGLSTYVFQECSSALGLIRFRGHRPKGGYDGQNGIKAGRETSATTVL